MNQPTPATAWRAVATGAATTAVYQLPLFLVGALAASMRQELGFGSIGLGVAVGVHWGVFALASPAAGTLADAMGAPRALRAAALTAGIAAAVIGVIARSWIGLVAALIVVGLASALGQPAANRLLSDDVPPARLGLAFGLKQSAPPLASMLAGLSVPVATASLGWRGAFVISAVLAVVLSATIRGASQGRSLAGVVTDRHRRNRPSRPRVRPDRRGPTSRTAVSTAPFRLERRGTLVVLGIGFATAFATSTSLLAFLVDSSVAFGMTDSTAGTVLAVASVAAIATRLSAGRLADTRAFDPLIASAVLLLLGASGVSVLALAAVSTDGVGGIRTATLILGLGATLGLAGTWGFPGLFWFAVVRAYPNAPGRVTGVLAPAMIGGTVGPVVFGWIVAGPGYSLAWGVGAIASLLAALAMVLGSRRLPATRR